MSEVTTGSMGIIEEAEARPTFLTVLCVLTFIGSGLGVLFGLLLTFGLGTMLASIPGMEAALAGGTAYFATGTVIAAASLYGAIQMWKLQKLGFFIYAGASVVGILSPLLFGLPFSIAGAIVPGLFIVLYYLNVKHMS
tara:strand:- start:1572 stop:1985 length:414 start_codon:yes stop_codon:yes gene_type:complete